MRWMAGCAVLSLAWAFAVPALAQQRLPDFGPLKPSSDAAHVARWVLDAGDSNGRPFLIVDKKDARLYVFAPDGRLQASTAVLLGATLGDESVPGVGQRAQTREVGADERTTPAGRFLTTPGRNLAGEHVVWVDYASAFAIHRLRPGAARERREARLASATPADNRISLGCVVVPVAFYEEVVLPLLGRTRGVVYVLPEMRPVKDFFEAS